MSPNKPKLQLQMRSVYGSDRIYPVNDTAKLFVQLTGRKTLFTEDLKIATALGFDLEWVPQGINILS